METKLKCFKCGSHCEDSATFCGGTKPFRQPGPLCESCWELPQADLDAACDAFFGRASAQREGGFTEQQWVLHGSTWAGPGCSDWSDGLHAIASIPGSACLCGLTIEQAKERGYIPRDPATALPEAPPQPAPMTRAARVLAGMETDPYGIGKELSDMERHKAAIRNEKARERMAAMTVDLDREQTHDPKRWAQLYGPVHPVTSRAVRGRR